MYVFVQLQTPSPAFSHALPHLHAPTQAFTYLYQHPTPPTPSNNFTKFKHLHKHTHTHTFTHDLTNSITLSPVHTSRLLPCHPAKLLTIITGRTANGVPGYRGNGVRVSDNRTTLYCPLISPSSAITLIDILIPRQKCFTSRSVEIHNTMLHNQGM